MHESNCKKKGENMSKFLLIAVILLVLIVVVDMEGL